MPRGPRGEKRPADVIGAAVKIARIALGAKRLTTCLTMARTRLPSLTDCLGESNLTGSKDRWRGA